MNSNFQVGKKVKHWKLELPELFRIFQLNIKLLNGIWGDKCIIHAINEVFGKKLIFFWGSDLNNYWRFKLLKVCDEKVLRRFTKCYKRYFSEDSLKDFV